MGEEGEGGGRKRVQNVEHAELTEFLGGKAGKVHGSIGNS